MEPDPEARPGGMEVGDPCGWRSTKEMGLSENHRTVK